MKVFSQKKNIVILVILVIFMIILAFIAVFTTFGGSTTGNFSSIEDAIQSEKIESEKIIKIVDLKNEVYILVDNNNSLETTVFRKKIIRKKTVFNIQNESEISNFFSNNEKLVGIDTFTRVIKSLEEAPKSMQKVSRNQMYSTTKKAELGLEINRKKANQIVSYKNYYFLFFEDINFNEKTTVTVKS